MCCIITYSFVMYIQRGKAVFDKISTLFDIVKEVLVDANLGNQKRAVEMLKESKVRKQSSVLSSGHTYAASRLGSKFSFLGYIGEVTGGLTSVRFAQKLVEEASNDWPAVQARLERIRQTVLKKQAGVINLTGDKRTLTEALSRLNAVSFALPEAPAASDRPQGGALLHAWRQKHASVSLHNEGYSIPSQVNYVCKGGPIYSPGEAVSASTSVVTRFLSTGYVTATTLVHSIAN